VSTAAVRERDGVARVRERRHRARRRERTVTAALAAVLLALAALALTVGGFPVPPADVAAALLGRGDGLGRFVVLELRLPRLAMGVLVGAAFGVAGALFQSVLGNPLASPDILGISWGASAAAVYALLVLGLGALWVSAAAVLGAVGVAAAIYLLAWRDGETGNRFVLIGIGAAFMANSALGYMLTRSDVREAQAALVWMVGSVGSSRWHEIALLAAAMAVLLPVAGLGAARLRALQLGDDLATGLGVPAEAARRALLAAAVGLAAVGTAAAGPIAFVAFVAAPIARRLTRTGGLALVPAALTGAVVVAASDLVALHLLPGDVQLPVGVVTGAIGAPYLLWLLATSGRGAA
jgi:iron complex transport system permease protein